MNPSAPARDQCKFLPLTEPRRLGLSFFMFRREGPIWRRFLWKLPLEPDARLEPALSPAVRSPLAWDIDAP